MIAAAVAACPDDQHVWLAAQQDLLAPSQSAVAQMVIPACLGCCDAAWDA